MPTLVGDPPEGRRAGAPVGDASAPPTDDAATAYASEAELRSRRWLRRGAWLGLVAFVFGGLALLALLPVRAWVDQRGQIRDADRRLAELRDQNARLAEQAAALQTPARVDEVARDEFNLVKPGEAAYAVLPTPTIDPSDLPAEWPYTLVRDLVNVRS